MLYGYELKKLLLTPAIIGFVALCIAINIIVVAAYDVGLNPVTDAETIDVFANFEAAALAEHYIGKYQVSANNAEHIRAKYAALQPVIDEKSANGDALSPYFGYATYQMHGLLFGIILKALIAETCVVALFLALTSANYENFHNTENIVCASLIGRRALRVKLASALTAAIAAFTVMAAVTLAVYFVKFDYSEIWNSNVSSAFNVTPDEYGKPFITWRSFTVAGLLAAQLAAAAALTLGFALIGFAVGTFVRSGYGSAVVAILLCFALFVTEWILPVGSIARNALNLTPVNLWARSQRWFTDGNADIITPNFETVGLAVSIIVLTALTFMAYSIYKRRDLQ